MEFLNEIEKAELAKINDNPTLLNAVKKVLLSMVYYEGILVPGQEAGDPIKNFVLQKAAQALQQNPSITNEMLGETLRADTQALRLVELGVQEIAKFKISPVSEKKKDNPAR